MAILVNKDQVSGRRNWTKQLLNYLKNYPSENWHEKTFLIDFQVNQLRILSKGFRPSIFEQGNTCPYQLCHKRLAVFGNNEVLWCFSEFETWNFTSLEIYRYLKNCSVW